MSLSITKGLLLNCIPILYSNCLMLGQKTLCNAQILVWNNLFDFQAVTYSVFFSSFNTSVVSVAW